MSRRRTISCLMLVFTAAVCGAQAFDYEYIEGKRLEINLNTRILGSGRETIWHMESNRITISGEAVKVKLSGENLTVLADITPYLNSDNTILLIAKGEIFLADNADSENVKYYTTLKSLPVTAGEKVVFFPLGMGYDSKSNLYSMEMEIQVLPVEDSEEVE